MSKCRAGKAAIHTTLHAEMKAKYDQLVTVTRAVEDAEDALVDAVAGSEAAEEAFEDIIRDTDGDLARLDRESPELSALSTVFPNGFGAEIEPDGEKQLDVLPGLKARLGKLKAQPVVAAALARVEAAESALRAAFLVEDKAGDEVDRLFTEESEARREVREQMESAYGRLRDFYKGRPALAERFFQKEGRSRNSDKKTPPAGSGNPGPVPAGGTP